MRFDCGTIGCTGRSSIVDSRWCQDTKARRRRRICDKCGARFTTYERGAASGSDVEFARNLVNTAIERVNESVGALARAMEQFHKSVESHNQRAQWVRVDG